MNKTISVLILLAIILPFSLIQLGCGNSNTPKTNGEYAQEYLDNAYDAFDEVNYEQALTDVNTSIAYQPTSEAFLFKAQIQYCYPWNTAEAFETLVSGEALFADEGAFNLIRAYFLCINTTSEGDQILTNLQLALNKDYGGIGYESFWAMVEEFNGFFYFRNNFPTQYASLEAQKTSSPALTVQPGGVTKYVKKDKVGPAIYVAHGDMWMIKAVRDCEAMLARIFVPAPYGGLVSAVIQLRTTFIYTKDKGNGVKLQWTYASWIPSMVALETFWASSQ